MKKRWAELKVLALIFISALVFGTNSMAQPVDSGGLGSRQPKGKGVRIIPQAKFGNSPHVVEGQILVRFKEELLPKKKFPKKELDSKKSRGEKRKIIRQIRKYLIEERREALAQLSKQLERTFINPKIKIKAIPTLTLPLSGIQTFKVFPKSLVKDAMKLIQNLSLVKYVVRSGKVYPLGHNPFPPNDNLWHEHKVGEPSWSKLWGLERIGMRAAWTDITGGDTLIAVIDSGIDSTHPDLAGNITTGGTNFTALLSFPLVDPEDPNQCKDPQDPGVMNDETGHGTMMAGILAAVGNNNFPLGGLPAGGNVVPLGGGSPPPAGGNVVPIGGGTPTSASNVANLNAAGNVETSMVGVNWSARLMPLKIWCIRKDNTDNEFPKLANSIPITVLAIEHAIQQDADIVNASFVMAPCPMVMDHPETPCSPQELESYAGQAAPLLEAIQTPESASVFIVVGAGNDGTDNDDPSTPVYPAKYGHPSFSLENLVVAAASDKADVRWSSSNFGSQGSVHIAAPGKGIFSTLPPLASGNLTGSFIGQADGTSMAVPFVAGCAALLQAMRVTMASPPLTPQELKTILTSSGDQPQVGGNNSIDGVVEGRRLNCHEALHQFSVCEACTGTAPAAPTDLTVNP